MPKNNKRISKRVYPKRNCKQCDCEFEPHDAREVYCCEQHRIDYNNDLRRLKDAPLKDLNGRIVNNEKILKKFYETLIGLNQESLSIDFLILDKYDFNVPCETSINKVGNKIEWQLSYGLEGVDEKKRLFKIHKR
ncbi:MAG: hypothetical protein IPN43_11395 [Chitinophagaceae bacterium]|nr:hypothetical protein [Chitinophagaceae bacterium]MBK8787067.1 hypothetical protein [Chitinophagaceae bacterium]